MLNVAIDQNSSFIEPSFVTTTDFRLKCDNGSSLKSSNVLPIVSHDKNGNARGGSWVWKGAYNQDMTTHTIRIDGVVTDGTDTIRAGKVLLYGDKTENVLFDNLGTATIDSEGGFSFTAPFLRNYWVKIVPNNSLYPDYLVSYHDGELRWDDAMPFEVSDSCTGGSVNVFPRKMEVIETGSYSISGTVTNSGGTNKVEGTDPIPGLDVVLDKIPPSRTVARTTTDAYGYYSFGNLPEGIYVVSIEYSGLPADTLYEVELANEEDAEDLDYCVDTLASIQGCSPAITSSKDIIDIVLNIYPNPFTNEFQVEVNAPAELSVYSLSGKLMLKKEVSERTLIQSSKGWPSGVYFVSIKNETGLQFKKVIRK